MEVREVSRLLDSMCWQKLHQGDAVRVAPIDYNALRKKVPDPWY